ncbi:tryptophan synthase subunit alpha [Anoxynatronum buryatiense]|uniref:Tryptophan synthase alpha chain n=1 Tax=Anoxynatronum buryatiense TaxID=489973 RepID=A0AA45WX93_9CLOT|nr:tryptophan synthase subunit alpha [Anoxynatronum buryatiense]SMP61654.1 tryptophan synthase, alpha chain [Anoxynatronum buryatiense]
MNNRIAHRFTSLKEAGRKALIPFVTAGDPSASVTLEMITGLEAAGADTIELGMPYSDPLADGPVLQRAAQRALEAGMTPNAYFQLIKEARRRTELPLVGLVYVNTLFQYGWEAFGQQAANAGLDGLIIPDLPRESRYYHGKPLTPLPVTEIRLVAPTSKHRIQQIAGEAQGFLYCIASLGVTGARQDLSENLIPFMEEVSRHSACPTALGFGISSPEMIQQIRRLADGFIVGSALVAALEKGFLEDEGIRPALNFVRELRRALDKT